MLLKYYLLRKSFKKPTIFIPIKPRSCPNLSQIILVSSFLRKRGSSAESSIVPIYSRPLTSSHNNSQKIPLKLNKREPANIYTKQLAILRVNSPATQKIKYLIQLVYLSFILTRKTYYQNIIAFIREKHAILTSKTK